MRYGAALLGAVALLALTSPVEAKRFTAWYFGVDGGANFVEDLDVTTYVTPAPVPVANTATFDTGWAAFATAGYAFQNNWRMELEGGYRLNDLDSIAIGGAPPVPLTGEAQEYTLMANLLYDFESMSDVTMSLGVGAGGDYARLSATSLVPPFEDQQLKVAFQALIGLSYPITSWLDMTLNYRYLYVTDIDFSDDNLAPPAVSHIDTDPVQKHSVTLGFRFGGRSSSKPMMASAAPPPPPPPPAPPPVARQYVIFFGFNKCNITQDADSVLSEAVASARTVGSTSIKIVGHTDTVGSLSANQILSECRANAAKMNLVSKGVSPSQISAIGRGETQLLVQTPNNVKEPQNRRATIDL